jgi:hypothetical protein
MPITLNGTTGITTPTYNGSTTAEYIVPVTGFKNRIINGDMTIDQRNAGASVSLVSGGGNTFSADRWYIENATDGTATVQQITDAPTGFSNSIRYTVTATDTSLASDQAAFIQQRIEGFNFADMLFGTANAQTVTVSFWVKSSVTGTFGVALANSAYNRGYPVSFTVNAANTWEQKFVTIAGDTTGTWIGSTNGTGVRVSFGMAAGSARASASGAWAAATVLGVNSQTNLMATNGATFQVTGVQLEKGSNATSFDYLPYGTELSLCQRYGLRVEQQQNTGDTCSTGTNTNVRFIFPTTMRTAPTASLITAGSWILGNGYSANYTASSVSISAQALTAGGGRVNLGGFSTFGSNFFVSGSDAVGTAVMFMSSEL